MDQKQILEKKYWSIEEVAIVTGMAKKTIYQKTYMRKIPYIKAGKGLLFDRDKILEWLESKSVKYYSD